MMAMRIGIEQSRCCVPLKKSSQHHTVTLHTVSKEGVSESLSVSRSRRKKPVSFNGHFYGPSDSCFTFKYVLYTVVKAAGYFFYFCRVITR
jgi:hypothetical protein